MQKPKKFEKGDKVAIVSLSSGMLGENFCQHQLKLGIKRLKQFGLEPVLMTNALKGEKYLAENPQAKAQDIKEAFLNQKIKGIICAIGGFDTYKTLPFLLNDDEFKEDVKNNPKIFIGYSDSTINHLMFYKLGLTTFYGHSFLVDFAELDNQMLEYSKKSFEFLFQNTHTFEILSSPYWYEERKDFSINSLNIPRIRHKETKGYEILRGNGIIRGTLLGGCIDSIYEGLVGKKYSNQKQVFLSAQILPKDYEWKNKILFLETSEEKPNPIEYKEMIQEIERTGAFNFINALMIGKPQDESFYEEYKKILLEVTQKYNLPIIYNVNFGHAHPKTIIPYGLKAKIDLDSKRIFIIESFFD